MAYQTLYRTFRPKKFEDVSGQPQVTDVLKQQIERGKPGHAYLFCGTRGTGKTTTARILANALNCESPVNGSPCGKCDTCRSFEADACVDVFEIDAASNNGVDNIRDIREKAALLPVAGKYKVYIIDEVHMLSPGAFNALLKTLEEPPAHAVFVLATTEFRKIPKTIVSRCQRYDFKRISEEDIVARLEHVAKSIDITYDEDALKMLAAQSEGALRDALSLMDQCIAGGGSLTKQDVCAALGIADDVLLSEMCSSILAGDPSGVLQNMNQILDGGTSPAHVLQDTITELSRRLSRCGGDVEQAQALLRAVEILIAAQGTLRYSPAPGAVLTAALVRAALPSTDTDARNLALRIRKLEDRLDAIAQGAPVQPAARSAQAVQTRTSQPAAVQAAALEMDQPAPRRQDTSGSDKLRELQRQIEARNSALGPPAKVLTELVEKPGEVAAKVSPNDMVLAEMLLTDSAKEDLTASLEAVFGAPAPRFRLESAEEKKKQSVDETQGIVEDLVNFMGDRDKVEIVSHD